MQYPNTDEVGTHCFQNGMRKLNNINFKSLIEELQTKKQNIQKSRINPVQQ